MLPESRSSGLSARRRQYIRIWRRRVASPMREARSSGFSESRPGCSNGLDQANRARSANRSNPTYEATYQPLSRETCDDFVAGLLLRCFTPTVCASSGQVVGHPTQLTRTAFLDSVPVFGGRLTHASAADSGEVGTNSRPETSFRHKIRSCCRHRIAGADGRS